MSAETGLIIVVPEAEPLVGTFRGRYDPHAAIGVPAHITALYPFMPPDRIGADILADLKMLCAGIAPFSFRLTGTGRFPDVVYLTPEPVAPFAALTHLLWKHYPGYPPYGGIHEGVTPHLTVAHQQENIEAIAAEFETQAIAHLPITGKATELALLENSTGLWRRMAAFPFGG